MSNDVRTVLIVDDVPQIRKAINDALMRDGMDVLAAARNGQEAIDYAQKLKPDFVLLDIVMPIMQGYEALPEIRRLLPDAIIVMLTSTSEQNLVLECRKAGANGFIIKSDDIADTLSQRLMMLWNKRQAKLEANK